MKILTEHYVCYYNQNNTVYIYIFQIKEAAVIHLFKPEISWSQSKQSANGVKY